MTDGLHIVAFAGSLRRNSYNRALLRAAVTVAPPGMRIEILDLADIPLFNADVEAVGDPAPVATLKSAIAAADGILLATPEYLHGVSGVLKNALDWASRPPRGATIMGKPAAVLGASTGRIGTARAQEQLRSVLAYLDCPTVTHPEVLVAAAAEKVGPDGEFTDPATIERVAALLAALGRLIRLHAAGDASA